MNDVHMHKAEEVIDDLSNFQIWPFTRGTGCEISDLDEPHMHDFYVIQYVTEGSGTQIIDFKPYEITPRSLYFVTPRQLHLWRPDAGLTGYIMAFGEDFLNSTESPVNTVRELDFFHSIVHSPVLRASRAQADILTDLLHKVSSEFSNRNSGYESVLRAFFHIFLVNLQRMFGEELARTGESREPQLARRFKQVVAEKYATQPSVQEYADLLGVSVSRLNSVVKEATGRTPGQIARSELMTAAKRLLAHSDMNVAEICFQLSFEDPSYFGRFFKREAGLTPRAFREEARQKYQPLAK